MTRSQSILAVVVAIFLAAGCDESQSQTGKPPAPSGEGGGTPAGVDSAEAREALAAHKDLVAVMGRGDRETARRMTILAGARDEAALDGLVECVAKGERLRDAVRARLPKASAERVIAAADLNDVPSVAESAKAEEVVLKQESSGSAVRWTFRKRDGQWLLDFAAYLASNAPGRDSGVLAGEYRSYANGLEQLAAQIRAGALSTDVEMIAAARALATGGF